MRQRPGAVCKRGQQSRQAGGATSLPRRSAQQRPQLPAQRKQPFAAARLHRAHYEVQKRIASWFPTCSLRGSMSQGRSKTRCRLHKRTNDSNTDELSALTCQASKGD